MIGAIAGAAGGCVPGKSVLAIGMSGVVEGAVDRRLAWGEDYAYQYGS